jgi:hypothetical protein
LSRRGGITPAGVQTVFEGVSTGWHLAGVIQLWVLTAGAADASQMQVYKLDWRSNQTLARMSSDGKQVLQGYSTTGQRPRAHQQRDTFLEQGKAADR